MPGQPCLSRHYLLHSKGLACAGRLHKRLRGQRCTCSIQRARCVTAGSHSSSRSHTASKLNQLAARPKRALGQNFCVSEPVLKSIVDAAGIQAGDYVLEIGPGALCEPAWSLKRCMQGRRSSGGAAVPGTGTLTRHLLSRRPALLVAVEKDDALAADLARGLAQARPACRLCWRSATPPGCPAGRRARVSLPRAAGRMRQDRPRGCAAREPAGAHGAAATAGQGGGQRAVQHHDRCRARPGVASPSLGHRRRAEVLGVRRQTC